MRELGTHCTNEECHEIQWSCGTNNLSPLRACIRHRMAIHRGGACSTHQTCAFTAAQPHRPHAYTASFLLAPRAARVRPVRHSLSSRISLLSRALPAPSLTARPRGRRPHLAPRLTRGK